MGQNNDDGEMLNKMSDIARKYQCLQTLKTTYLDSYQIRSEYKVPVPVTHTLNPYRQPNIPFNLYHKLTLLLEETRYRCRNDALRKLIVDDIYLTETTRSFNERVALVNTNVVKAPIPNFYSKPNPMALNRVREPYVSPEWRMDSVMWDTKQFRSNVDPAKKFWLSREKPEHESPS